jgi:cell division septation protein DedD
MSDEQFHEFHLDGKQMVFLFMASTVVAVVIFLCGVMVGRGVRTSRVEAFAGLDAPQQELSVEDVGPPSNVDLTGASPDIPDELTYSDRLQSQSPPPERVRPAVPAPRGRSESSAPAAVEAPPAFEPATATRNREERSPKPEAPVSRDGLDEPAGPGYVVQVASVPKLADAQAIRKTLLGKGYRTFITETPTTPKRYRVRVGKYPTEKEARAAERKLEQVEKFRDAWIPR